VLLGILLSIAASLAQLAGGLFVVKKKEWPVAWERTLLALGAGFLLALAFIELIPESFHLTNNSEFSVLAMLIGFSTLHFFEHTAVEHMHFGEETHDHTHVHHTSALGAVGGLTLHAFFDGMTIAAVAHARETLGVLVFIAVLLHKIPEGLTVASVMFAGKRSRQETSMASIILALATILGALTVIFFVTLDESWIGFLFAFSAGSAIYVGASDLIPEINKTKGRKAPFLVLLGMLLFYFSKFLIELTLGSH